MTGFMPNQTRKRARPPKAKAKRREGEIVSFYTKDKKDREFVRTRAEIEDRSESKWLSRWLHETRIAFERDGASNN
jgi:hypothetical protein